MTEWKPIETAPISKDGDDDELWLTDGKIVVRARFLGPYRTGYSISGRMGWFKLTHWQKAIIDQPEPPE